MESSMVHNPFIQLGVALTPVISSCPPKVFASFLSFPSNFSLSFSFMAVVLCSNLLLTCEYFTNFCSFIFTYFWVTKKVPVFGDPTSDVAHLQFLVYALGAVLLGLGYVLQPIC